MKKVDVEKSQQTITKHEKIPSMLAVQVLGSSSLGGFTVFQSLYFDSAEEDSLRYVIIRSKQFSGVSGVRKRGMSGARIFTCHGKLTLCMLRNFNMALFEKNLCIMAWHCAVHLSVCKQFA